MDEMVSLLKEILNQLEMMNEKLEKLTYNGTTDLDDICKTIDSASREIVSSISMLE